MKICCMSDARDIHTQRWVNYFARKGHEVHLISSSPGEGYTEDVRQYHLTVPVPQNSWVALRSINIIARIIKVRRLINKIKPDIINAHFITTYGFLGAASGFHPLVLTAWGSDILLSAKQSVYWRTLAKYALKKAELITCDGENLKTEMVKLGVDPGKITLIYHGVDTRKFSPGQAGELRVRLGLTQVPVVISTRKLRPLYDIETLIRAIPIVLRYIPGAKFLIAGEGEQKGYLESLAASLGVLESVRFLGWIPHDELPNYLASSDVYVSTSLSDSTSVSLLEAMACELPVVVTNSGDNEKWVGDGKNGFIVPKSNPDKLAEKIVYLLQNEHVRKEFAKVNRKTVEDKANHESEMSKMEKLYSELIRSQR